MASFVLGKRLETPGDRRGRFGVYLAVMAWGGLWLRDARLRSLFPWRRL